MSGYRIDAQVLRDVVAALDRGRAAVVEARGALGRAPVDDLGGDQLDRLVGELTADWAGTLAAVHGDVTDAGDGVRGCLADYADTERRVTELFGQDRPE